MATSIRRKNNQPLNHDFWVVIFRQLYFMKVDWNHPVWGFIIFDRGFCGATPCLFYLCRIGNRSLMEDEKHSKTKYLIVDTGDGLKSPAFLLRAFRLRNCLWLTCFCQTFGVWEQGRPVILCSGTTYFTAPGSIYDEIIATFQEELLAHFSRCTFMFRR